MDRLEDIAAALSTDPPSDEETVQLLDVARDVAHRAERVITPLSTFLLGMNVQRRIHEGLERREALTAAIDALRGALPPSDDTAER
jgi:hypothetical protein